LGVGLVGGDLFRGCCVFHNFNGICPGCACCKTRPWTGPA
jgi:hypothetical protein